MNTKLPNQNPGQNPGQKSGQKPGQNQDKNPVKPENPDNGGGDSNDPDIDREFRHNTPHESQPERAVEESFDPESEKLIQRNTIQGQRDQVNPRDDRPSRR